MVISHAASARLTWRSIGTILTIVKEPWKTAGYAAIWDKDEEYDLLLDKGLCLIDSQQ